MRKLVYLLFILNIASCSPLIKNSITLPTIVSHDILDNYTFLSEKIINFNNDDEKKLYDIRNGYSNGGMFLSVWNRKNISLKDDIALLSLYDDFNDNKNYGSEIRVNQGYLYGYFGTRMKVFKKEGTVQSFFTYNGGQYEHDEIDIEFLGKDTTKVQFNYFDDGIGNHEYLYDLGFDASEDYHDYGFLWEQNRIIWFVDFKPVYYVEATLEQWGFIYINVWAGNNENPSTQKWLGTYIASEEKKYASYDYISYKAI